MQALYRRLLRLYPAGFRGAFGEEMACVFAEAEAAARQAGVAYRCKFYAREIAGMLGGALVEQAAAGGLNLESRRFAVISKRNGFRFPAAGITFMVVTLGLVLWAIRNAQTIANSLASKTYVFQGRTYSYETSDLGLAPSFGIIFALTLAVTVAVLAVRHVMRRSGAQRLEDAQTWPQQ